MHSDADIIRDAQEKLTATWIQDRENREDGYMDLKFLAGDQWPQAIRLDRESSNRPCLTINRLPQFVNQVANNVRQNPPALKAIPSGGGASQDMADIYSGILREIQYRSNATHVFAQAMFHSVACGIGHYRVVTDYCGDNVFDQEILIKSIPHPLSVFWDANATDIARADAQHCIVSDLIGHKEFRQRFPDAAEADFITPADLNVENGLFWNNRDVARIVEYWTKVYKRREIARLSTGETVDLTDLDGEAIAPFKERIVATRKVDSTKVVQYLLSAVDVLDGPNDWAGNQIPIFPVIGSEVPLETKILRMGLVRFARDPQQLYNFWRSASAEAIGQSQRSHWLVTPKMISKFKGQWDTMNVVTRPYLLYEPDDLAPGNMPRLEGMPQIPEAYYREFGVASDEMKATTGIYDAALGARSNEISGIAIKARETQGANSALHYEDNLMASLKRLGDALVDLIPKIYDTDRAMHLLGEDGETLKHVRINVPVLGKHGEKELVNDLSVGQYQVHVKMAPAYATRRQESVASMLELLSAYPQVGPIIGDIIVKNMDFPGAQEIASRLRTMLPPNLNPEPPTPEQQQAHAKQQQMQDAMAQAQLAEHQGKAFKSAADAAKSHAQAQQIAQQPPQPQGLGGAGGLSPEDQSLIAGRDAAHQAYTQQQEREANALKNLLLSYTVQEKAAHTSAANMLIQSRQLDNERKLKQLSQPVTQKIP